jgi:hypothetical protein
MPEKWQFLTKQMYVHTASFVEKISLEFTWKSAFFPRKLVKMAESGDHNIGPRVFARKLFQICMYISVASHYHGHSAKAFTWFSGSTTSYTSEDFPSELVALTRYVPSVNIIKRSACIGCSRPFISLFTTKIQPVVLFYTGNDPNGLNRMQSCAKLPIGYRGKRSGPAGRGVVKKATT